MKICRFNGNRLGLIVDGVVRDVTSALGGLPVQPWPLPLGDLLIANLESVLKRAEEVLPDAPAIPVCAVRLESPVANPSKIIGAPVNYRAHEAEIDDALRQGHSVKPIAEWGLFLKAGSALCGPGAGIDQRFLAERTDHEVELAVIIGRRGTNISVNDALGYIAGYAIGLDITLRGPQFQSFRKSIDSYAVLGPWLVTADEIPDPSDLEIGLEVDGVLRQHARTSQLIMSVPQLIAFASRFYTLYPGDVIMTGSPEGVGPIRPGNLIAASVERIGEMQVAVRAAASEGEENEAL